MYSLVDFIRESNRIEGIDRDPTYAEIEAHLSFIGLSCITISDLEKFVFEVQPGAYLRDREGLNVRVGNHLPPKGGPAILTMLDELLKRFGGDTRNSEMAYRQHQAYEVLHPFTDANGRSGRALWLWKMGGRAPLGFLHQWYYQTLQFSTAPVLCGGDVA